MNVNLTESTAALNATRRQRTQREPAASEAAAFDALLAGLRPVPLPSLDTLVLPESQMFEAPDSEGSDRPQVREEPGALSDQSDQSRTGVRARRAAAESASRNTQQPEAPSSEPRPSRGMSERATEASPDHRPHEVAPEGRSRLGSIRHGAERSQSEAAPSKQSTPVARSDAAEPTATTQRASAAGEIRPADTASSRTQSAAKMIGRALGAPQSTGAESVRATGTGQRSPDQGKTVAGKSPASSKAPAKQQSASESSFARMVRSLRITPGSRNSSATIRLEPERLGRMHVNVKMSGDRISIEVRTETMEARALVASRAAELRSALEQQGLQIERFDVRADLADAAAVDRPLGPKAEDRDESGGSKRGLRRRVVASRSSASARESVPLDGEATEGDDTVASPTRNSRSKGSEVARMHRRHVDIRV